MVMHGSVDSVTRLCRQGPHWFRWSVVFHGRAICRDSLSTTAPPACTASGDRKRKPLVSRRSSWLFTHFGFSGPAAMDVSGTLTAAESFADVSLRVDLLPDTSEHEITAALIGPKSRKTGGRVNAVAHWLPQRLAAALTKAHGATASIAELPKKSLLCFDRRDQTNGDSDRGDTWFRESRSDRWRRGAFGSRSADDGKPSRPGVCTSRVKS